MRVAVTSEGRFQRLPDGSMWVASQFSYSFWTRYLDVFDEVRVVARAEPVASVPPSYKRLDGPSVTFFPVPYYLGPRQFLRVRGAVTRALAGAALPADAIVLRMASTLANMMEPALVKSGHPFGVELVGDPRDAYAPGAVRHPLRPFFRYWFTRSVERQCREACAVSYVTKAALQRAYPASPGVLTTDYSSIELPEEALAAEPRPAREGPGPFKLVFVGTLEQLYKAPDILVAAVADAVAAGADIALRMVGGGKYQAELEAAARAGGLGGRVSFTGEIASGAAVRAELDAADLFVLPSRQEGLPRGLIEAMARGLPAIGSTVGGIPELLPPRCLVPPGDVKALSARIREVLAGSALRRELGARNLAKAREYLDTELRPRRVAFYRCVQEKTEAWIRRRGVAARSRR
jgi:glycosyltransferase involved in cell wall biosynthesis